MEFVYIIGFIVFLILAKVVKKTNKILSKIFNTIGIGAVILTFTNLGNQLALHFNNPMISTVCMILSIIFFVSLIIKFWIKTIKVFIIAIILFIMALVPTGLDTYIDFQNIKDNVIENVENIEIKETTKTVTEKIEDFKYSRN